MTTQKSSKDEFRRQWARAIEDIRLIQMQGADAIARLTNLYEGVLLEEAPDLDEPVRRRAA